MDDQLLKLMIVNLPNFLGFVVCVYIMNKQNMALLDLLRECNERNEGSEGEIA